jgi:hypothetical protein
MGPQYRRSYPRSMPFGTAPYDVSPSLRIAVALSEPHSLGSMGGIHTPSPGAEFWRISLEPYTLCSSTRLSNAAIPQMRETAVAALGGGGTAAAAAAAARVSATASAPAAAPVPPGSAMQQYAGRMQSMERSGSFCKYSAFYSGMDVGITPPISTYGGIASSAGGQGLSSTPRPNELLANAMPHEWYET